MNHPPKNYYLESIRGIAALSVFVCHIFSKIPEISQNANHMTSFFSNWGTEAVIIFFVLSGLVIHMSFEKQPRTMLGFLKNRIVRLHPILIIAVCISAFVDFYLLHLPFSWSQLIGNFIPIPILNTTITPLYTSNPVIWSLSFEVFFYAFFSLCCISDKKINYNAIRIWVVISIIAIVLLAAPLALPKIIMHFVQLFAFSSIWLVGFFIWKYRNQVYTNRYFAVFSLFSLPLISRLHILPIYYDPIKYLLFALVSWPFFQYVINRNKTTEQTTFIGKFVVLLALLIYLIAIPVIILDEGYQMLIKCLYIFFPIGMLIALVAVKKQLILAYRAIEKLTIYLGKISYSLYVIHYPIIIAINFISISIILKLALIFFSVLFSTYLLDFKFQPYINKKFK